MEKTITYSSCASLVALGVRFQQMGIWPVIAEHVHIQQKVLKHKPLEKLLDCFINMLAGGSGLVEINTLVRPNRSVQRAFGRERCAEQSTVSDTLDACTATTVEQMRAALKVILHQHSGCCAHDYEQQWQLLDVDVTGLPAGRQGEGVTKGYFAHQKNRRGRQLGRVLATHYDEIIVERLYTGKRQLDHSLCELVEATEALLDLTKPQQKRTILRIDAGGGDDHNINWILERDYHLLIKARNWRRAEKLAASVTQWSADPKLPEREVGWVEQPHRYARATRQVALRKRKANGKWSYHVLVFTLSDEMLFELCAQPMPPTPQALDLLLAAVHAYDLRSGGLETQNKGDKQGLALAHRNKSDFAAQEMLVLLAQLAHDLLIWTRNDLAQVDARFQHWGILRLVRDVLQIAGRVCLNAQGHVEHIVLNELHPFAAAFQKAFARHDLSLVLGKI